MHLLMIEAIQKVQQHLVLVFFEQMPKLFDPAKLSLQLTQGQVPTKIKSYKLPEKLYQSIPFYPSVPVDFKFNFELLHSTIVFDALAITLEK